MKGANEPYTGEIIYRNMGMDWFLGSHLGIFVKLFTTTGLESEEQELYYPEYKLFSMSNSNRFARHADFSHEY